MSGIFGIFNRSGKSVSPDIMQGMLSTMSYWNPDETGNWSEGPITLGHTMLWTTPESKHEQLPHATQHDQRKLVITADVRLDNRSELINKLGMLSRAPDLITDTDLLLGAYRKWGESSPEYLLGDFAYAIWDKQEQKLFCVRDHIGIKPFYYYLSDSLFVFCNDLKGLVSHPDISKNINDEAVVNFLANNQLLSPTLTFFNNVQKLPPAHWISITPKFLHKRRYWRVEDTPKLDFPDDSTYTETLRSLLEQAVHDRLRSLYPITSHLSGGLDSSCVAVIASRKLQQNNKSLLAFNWLHEPDNGDDKDHYEWSNSKTIAETEGIEHHYVQINNEYIYYKLKHHNISYGDTTSLWYEFKVRDAATSAGSRTILTGWGGDDFISYPGYSYYSDLFLQGKVTTVLREFIQLVHKNKTKFKPLISAMYKYVFFPLVPRSLYCHLPRSICRDNTIPRVVIENFIPALQKEINKPRALTMQPQPTIRAHMIAHWENGHIQNRIDSWAASSFANRIEYVYPLLDKRVIEFAVGMPPNLFVKNGVVRNIFRTAAEGFLPEKILWGNSKYELRRVKRLISSYKKAFKKWRIDPNNSKLESSYIDLSKVNETIELLLNKENDLLDIPAIEQVLNALLVLRLDR